MSAPRNVLYALLAALLAAAIVSVVILVAYRWLPGNSPRVPAANEEIARYRAQQQQVRKEGAAAVPELERQLAGAMSPNEIAASELFLGIAQLDGTTTAAEGLSTLKVLSIQGSAHPFYRAAAAERVAVYGMARNDPAFSRGAVFTGPTWSGFLQGTTTIPYAYLAALKWSDSLSPSFLVEYRIGWLLAAGLPLFSDPRGRRERIDEVEAWLAKADKGYQATLNATFTEDHSFSLGVSLVLKANALTVLYLEGFGSETPDDIAAIYRQAIATLEEPGAPKQNLTNALYARYYLALLLANNGTAADRAALPATMAPVYAAFTETALKDADLFAALRRLGPSPGGGSRNVRRIKRLAAAEPRFKSLLLDLGWKDW